MTTVVRRFAFGAVCWLLLAGAGYAQQATLSGTITDASGGVLPGVTVTATHEATGNIFTAVTDERGGYRLVVRPGRVPHPRRAPGLHDASTAEAWSCC